MTASQRRSSLKLPRRRTHIFGVLTLLLAAIFIPSIYIATNGSPEDARASGQIALPPPPDIRELAALDQYETDFPDLLDGEIEDGENPTLAIAQQQASDTVDALGNPVAEPAETSTPRIIDVPDQALAPLDAALTRSSRFGVIPGPSSNGRTPLSVYKRDASVPSDRQPVALVIGGLGINGALTRRAIDELPADVTLSFAAHAPNLQMWIDDARKDGHEVLLEIPMESDSFNPDEPGANRALLVDAAPTDNVRNLHFLLSRAQGYIGVINYNGDVFLGRADSIAPVLDELSKSGLGLIADGSFPVPTLPTLSNTVGLSQATGNGLIDPTPDQSVIQSNLDKLSGAADGSAIPIGVGFAYPQTINAVKGWAATLGSDGLVLVPASAALQ